MSWLHHLLMVHSETVYHSAGGVSFSLELLISLSLRKEVERAAKVIHLQRGTTFEEELGK